MNYEIKIWAQMFFDDGSVSQGVRISAEFLEEQYAWKIQEVADMLFKSVNREHGWLLLWGAGNMVFQSYSTSSCSSQASELDS